MKRNITLALRSFRQKLSFTIINVFGLTIGMTVSMLILGYARYELSYDRFHGRADNIYRLTVAYHGESGRKVFDAQTYPGSGLLAVEEFPEISDYAMARNWGRLLFKKDDKVFNEDRTYFVNPGWLNIFDWNFLQGNASNALNRPDMVVLSKSSAEKYFGDADPVGQTIEVVLDGEEVELLVNGVFADVPVNAHLKFDILISYETGISRLKWEYDTWSTNNEYLYVLANSDRLLEGDFEQRLNEAYLERTGGERSNTLQLQPLTDIHLKSDKTFEAEVNGSEEVVNILLLVAGLVLIIAWVNYVNLSTARALDRAKEVGIRKVLGSGKKALFNQFLTESFLINFLALILTITCIQGVLPVFKHLSGLDLKFAMFRGSSLLLQMVAVFFAGSLAAGTYPALVLANYSPGVVLSGKFRNSKSGLLLRKGLVVFQFSMTLILFIGTLTIYQQINYMRSQELGVNIDQTVVIQAPVVVGDRERQTQFRNLFRTRLAKLPEVKYASFSGTIFGQGSSDMSTSTSMFAVETGLGKGNNYYFHSVDEAFVPAFDITVLAGRMFDNELERPFADSPYQYEGVVINEKVRELFGFQNNEEAIGKKVNRWGRIFTIVGVVNNYNHHSLKKAVDPMVLFFDKDGVNSNYIAVKIENFQNGESYRNMVAKIEKAYRDIYTENDFDYYFLNEQFDQQYKADKQFGLVFSTFSALSILISLLGLFGLVLYEIQQRTKEIGIRKVLGAGRSSIVRLLSSSFLRLIVFSAIIAVPLAYWGTDTWLADYAYRIQLSWYLFLVPGVVILLVALLTIAAQTLSVAKANPVDALRCE